MPRHTDNLEYKDRLLTAFLRAKKLNSRGDPDRAWLAEKLGVSVQAIGHALTGVNELSLRNNAHAAKHLNCNAHWLATGEESIDQPNSQSGPFSAELLITLRTMRPDDVRRIENGIRAQLDMDLLPSLGKDQSAA